MIRRPAWSRGRWTATALAASLVLNGFLLGWLAVDSLRPQRAWQGSRILGYELRRLAGRLPADALKQVEAELKPLAPEFDERFARLRAERDEAYRLASVENPDRAAIDAQLAGMRAERERLQIDLQRASFDALLKLPPAARAGLAEPARRR